MLVNPILAADTGQQKEKVVDDTKEKETKITNKDKSITGDIKVTTKDVSKFSVKKKSNYEISISKSGEHTKAKVSISKSELQKIDIDKDGKFGLLHISDTGEVTHTTATEAELVAGKIMTFSENIVNGYSGYKQYTFSDVESGDTLNIDDVSGNYTITAAVDGNVPTYTAITRTNASTYPQSANLCDAWLFENSTNGISGSVGTGTPNYFNYQGDTGIYGAGVSTVYNTRLKTSNNTGYTISYAFVPIVPINSSLAASMNVMSRVTGNTGFFTSFRSGIGGLAEYTYDGSAPKSLYTSLLSWNKMQKYVYTFVYTPTGRTVYINGIVVGTGAATNFVTSSGTLKLLDASADKIYLLDASLYNTSLNLSQVHTNYAGGSGISFQPEPSYNFTGYNVASGVEKVLNTDSTCTGIEYVDTTGGTHDVTVTVYFTEDTTLISEEHNLQYQNVSIVHIAGHNATNGTIAYELLSAYTGTPVLTGTNNTNASVGRNTTHVLVYTGFLKAGQSKYYNIKIAKSSEILSLVTPTNVVITLVPASIIVTSYIYRRRKSRGE